MNTGIQRSSATPIFAHTTTSPAGKEIPGKIQQRKDITFALASHGRGYIAQAVPSNFKDLMNKAKKAVEFKGPAFINVLSPCRLGWGYPPEDSIDIAKEAVDTCFWPLYEIEDGILNLNYKPKEKKPILPWLKRQARFMHLFKTKNSEELIKKIQEEIDRKWELLLSLDKKRIAG
jgi:pyruvate ferredoxin oxidoreductase beta subunit